MCELATAPLDVLDGSVTKRPKKIPEGLELGLECDNIVGTSWMCRDEAIECWVATGFEILGRLALELLEQESRNATALCCCGGFAPVNLAIPMFGTMDLLRYWRIVWAHPVRQVKLLDQRLAKCSFIALSAKNDEFVADLIIGHGEVVPTPAGRREACLGDRDPNLPLQIK